MNNKLKKIKDKNDVKKKDKERQNELLTGTLVLAQAELSTHRHGEVLAASEV